MFDRYWVIVSVEERQLMLLSHQVIILDSWFPCPQDYFIHIHGHFLNGLLHPVSNNESNM